MLDRVLKYFERQIAGESHAQTPEAHAHGVRLATAALLIEISRADSHISEPERKTVIDAVQRVFGLDQQETRELVELAEMEVEDAVSLYQFTQLVDTQFSPVEKKEIVELLWQVSFADGELDKYEEYLVRKIADLLHVSHADYIHAKHRAKKNVRREA